MSNSATYKFSVKSLNSLNYSLNSVVGQPRSSLPIDVSAACANVEIESASDAAPAVVRTVVRYVLTDFFALAHRTGLYNRQKLLWESIARVNEIDVFRHRQGIFQKTDLPYLDAHFLDAKGRPLILAHIVEPAYTDRSDDLERRLKDQVRSLQHRADKLKSSKGTLAGVFLCYPKPFPEIVLKMVEGLTGGSDPVGRFESILPEPLSIPIDLLEIDVAALARQEQSDAVRLVRPDLTVKGRTALPAKTFNASPSEPDV